MPENSFPNPVSDNFPSFPSNFGDNEFYDKGINFPLLAKTLSKYLQPDRSFKFNYANYISWNVHEPIERDITLDGKLNKKKDYINASPKYVKIWIQFLFDRGKIQYNLGINYRDNANNDKIGEFAIHIWAYTLDELQVFISAMGYGKFYLTENLKSGFEKAFSKNRKNGRNLNTLYKYSPAFILQDRNKEDLFNDLIVLWMTDDDSIFKDTSDAMIRLLVNIPDTKWLHDKLYLHAKEVMLLYDVLSDKNKDIFAAFLTILANEYGDKEQNSDLPPLVFNSDYTVDSNLFTRKGKLELTLIHKTRRTEWGANSTHTVVGRQILFSRDFNPLEIVVWINPETGSRVPVAALYVKRLSDVKEWDDLVEAVTAFILIVSIVLSAGTLAVGASGLVFYFAVADLVISAIDLILLDDDVRNFLIDSGDEGKWFVENWGYISLCAGVGMIGISTAKWLATRGKNVVKVLDDAGEVAAAREVEKLIDVAEDLIKREPIPVKEFADAIILDEVVVTANRTSKIGLLSDAAQELLKKYGWKINTKRLKKTIRVVDLNTEEVILRAATKEDIEKYLDFISQHVTTRKAAVSKADKSFSKSTAKFNPKRAEAKGVELKPSKSKLSVDFSKTPEYLHMGKKSIIKVKLTGSYTDDFNKAFDAYFKKLNIVDEIEKTKIRKKYVWHHLDDLDENLESSFQLVLRKIHNKSTPHIGSVAKYEKVFNRKYLK